MCQCVHMFLILLITSPSIHCAEKFSSVHQNSSFQLFGHQNKKFNWFEINILEFHFSYGKMQKGISKSNLTQGFKSTSRQNFDFWIILHRSFINRHLVNRNLIPSSESSWNFSILFGNKGCYLWHRFKILSEILLKTQQHTLSCWHVSIQSVYRDNKDIGFYVRMSQTNKKSHNFVLEGRTKTVTRFIPCCQSKELYMTHTLKEDIKCDFEINIAMHNMENKLFCVYCKQDVLNSKKVINENYSIVKIWCGKNDTFIGTSNMDYLNCDIILL